MQAPTANAQKDVDAPENAGGEREHHAHAVETVADPRREECDPDRGHRDPEKVGGAARADEGDSQRPDELQRDGDPQRNAVERLEEAEVHGDQRQPEGERQS
jgi:hypothetical protein